VQVVVITVVQRVGETGSVRRRPAGGRESIRKICGKCSTYKREATGHCKMARHVVKKLSRRHLKKKSAGALEPGDPPSRTVTWKPLGFLSHVKRRTSDDRFPLSLWEVWLCTQLGVPIPDLIGTLRHCPCNVFQIDCFGDHLQTCQVKSAATEVYDWAVYKLSGILGSVGHRVKIHKITSAKGKERGDLEIRDYVVL
jgi:hypothetical protein